MNKKDIAVGIALVIGVFGILNFIAEVYRFELDLYDLPWYLAVRPFKVKIPFVQYPIDILFCLLLIISPIVFLVKERALKIVAFLSALILAQQGTIVLVTVFRFLFSAKKYVSMLTPAFVPLLMAAGSFFILRFFEEEWKKVSYAQKEEASKGQRFWGYLIDILIVVIMINPFPYISEIYERLILVLLLLVYFTAFERLFWFTPGKLLLNTRVQTEEGEAPGERHVFVRNLARLIPLEPFSFFAGRGWHDTISRTSVYKYKQ
jgi:hypothetical protein